MTRWLRLSRARRVIGPVSEALPMHGDVAREVLFLARDDASFVSGINLMSGGGEWTAA